ncbi:MAG: hypothetical protein A3F61_00935 [Candidatus Blackburnbacteria bacterium RIFCSPHIGHO2_12_FULL_41_13b]|uniref:Glycosyltransferase RgtA/B/C/D-like domain-containing protein n=2 Tax=Candidatus Blackburniibacteriota TaxID=1817898 RepID=A0A1G1VC10_9BACT|nr:MAG: hypothetical protein A3F61_00935 [Candidatus Blackburnbacteria bacterium RIFCSPHIGHO2_12_FULL_41_13b]
MLKYSKFLLVGIILLAAVLRFFQISSFPPALNWDEISHGYNAYSILKTGKDEWGVSWPTIFRAYGDYKLPVNVYLTAISEALFGLNEFAVRLPSALAGVLTVVFTYLLASRLFTKQVGLVSAFLVAVVPWSLFLSRAGLEANLALTLFIAGIYFLFRPPKANFILPALLLGLSMWTYNSYRVFIPLLAICLYFIYRGSLRTEQLKKHLPAIAIFFLLLSGVVWQMANPEGQARYSLVAILDTGAINQIENLRNNSDLGSFASRIIYNKATYFGFNFTKNYLAHFNPQFLFIDGGTHYQFSIPGTSLLYLVNIPFFYLGVLLLLKERSKTNLFLLGCLLLAPVPSALTREAPHVLRSITFLPILLIITAFGFWQFIAQVKFSQSVKKYISGVYFMILIILLGLYLVNYFGYYTKNYSWAWQYGYKEVVGYAKTNYGKYDQIIVTKKYGEPHEFFLFYWPWDPDKYRNDPKLVRYTQSGWYWVDGFDKFIFVNDWEIPKNENIGWKTERDKPIDISSKTLLITSPNTYPPGWKKLKTIKFLDNKPAFDILENDVANN